MSDDNDNLFTEQHSPGELLNELGSLKELLDEELESVVPYTSVEEISSVEDYLRLKQQAATAELSIEEYLSQQITAQPVSDELEVLEIIDEVYSVDDEEKIDSDSLLLEIAEEEELTPTTAEATTVEEYFAAVVAAKYPQSGVEPEAPVLDEVVETPAVGKAQIPVLEEVFTPEDAIPRLDEVVATEHPDDTQNELSLEDMQDLVGLIVNRKLQRLKPERQGSDRG